MSTAATALSLEHLSRTYGQHRVVQDISFDIRKGTLLTLLGPSGCGKSTLLRMIAGFVPPSSGEIRIDGRLVTTMPPNRRPTAMVFQSYALFPHMTVFDNVAFGLSVRRRGRNEIRKAVDEALELVKMQAFGARYPSELSGGQQQRVALARCLVVRPEILLLDEPFGALDRSLREAMQVELRKLQRLLDITMLVVTHDQQEALVLSDQVAVMNSGRIEQLASPAGVYDRPANRFVAEFMGVSNILPGRVARDDDTIRFHLDAGGAISLAGLSSEPALPFQYGPAHLAVRPEVLRLVDPTDAAALFRGEVAFTSMVGSQITCEVRVGDTTVIVAVPRPHDPVPIGQAVGIAADPANMLVLAR